MKITAVDPMALGYRKSDPPMARNFAVVRVETDTGLVGRGEASTDWGDLADRFPFVLGDTYAEVFPDHETGRASR